MGYRDQVLADGAIGYWRLNDTGTDYQDVVNGDTPAVYYRLNNTTVNLVVGTQNANFQGGIGQWTTNGNNSTVTPSAVAGAVSGQSMAVSATAATAVASLTGAAYIPVYPGGPVTYSAYVKYSAGTARQVLLDISWFNGNSYLSDTADTAHATLVTGSWQRLTSTFIPPANATGARLQAYIVNAVTGDAVLISNVQLQIGATATAYSDPTTTIPDATSDTNQGNVHGGVSGGQVGPVAGGAATQFDGATGYITSSTNSGFGTTVSFETWVYPTAVPASGQLLVSIAGQTNYALALGATSGKATAYVAVTLSGTQQIVVQNGFLTLNAWHHIVATWDGTTLAIYVDGALSNSATFTGTFAPSPALVWINTNASTFQFGGMLAEAALYTNAALTAAQVATHYAAATHWMVRTVSDNSPTANNGLGFGTLEPETPGPITSGSGAALFDGTAAYVQTDLNVVTPANAITYEAWVYHTAAWSASYELILSSLASSSNYLTVFNGKVQFVLSLGGSAQTLTQIGSLGLNAWHHIVGTWDGTTQSIYIDGVVNNSSTPGGSLSAPNGLYFIGKYSGGGLFFNGQISEVAIYPAALTATKVAAHYAGATSPGPLNLPAAVYVARRGIYTYLFCDLVSGAVLTELQMTNVSLERRLNDAGSWSGQVPLGDPNIAKLAPIPSTQPGRTALYVDRDGTLIYGGIVWTRSYDSKSKALTLGGKELLSYFESRYIINTLAAPAQSPMVTAQQIINATQGSYAPHFGVNITDGGISAAAAQTYYWYQFKNVRDALVQLTQTGGFDMAVDVAYSGGVPTPTLNMQWPHRGVSATQSGVVFEMPGTIIDYTYPEDATKQGNIAHGTGAGNADLMLVATASDPNQWAAGWPQLEQVYPYKDAQTQSLLNAYTAAALVAGDKPITVPKVDILATGDTPLGSWTIGDSARFRITDERFASPTSGGPGLDMFWRIVGETIHPPYAGNAEYVTLTLGAAF